MTVAWPTAAETTLADLVERWGMFYDLMFTGGMYRAKHYGGAWLPEARTPDELRLVLMADWWRRGGGR